MQKKGQLQFRTKETMPSGQIEIQTAPFITTKRLGIWGFIFALIGIIVLNFQVYIGLFAGIVGIILCSLQSKKGKTGLGKTGLVISAIAIVWAALIIASRILMS